MKRLEVDITPIGSGYVVTIPTSHVEPRRTIWHHNDIGYFYDNTVVQVTAIPQAGFEFEKWSDHIEGGVSFVNPAYVKPLTQDRAVKCHFRETDLKVLNWHIIGEPLGGSISLSPQPLDAEGHYYKGTVVSLTAIVNPGFVFLRWHGTDNPGSTSLTNTVTMSENHTIRADFGFEEVEREYPLEVDIVGGVGYVTTNPAPLNIPNKFTAGTVGLFLEGTRVLVTAHPSTGYRFDHWSDEIQGGTSNNNPEWVSNVMDSPKTVKCHFREVEEPPTNGEPPPEPPPDVEPPPVEPPPTDLEGWLPWILIAGGAIIILSMGKEEPKRKPKSRKQVK